MIIIFLSQSIICAFLSINPEHVTSAMVFLPQCSLAHQRLCQQKCFNLCFVIHSILGAEGKIERGFPLFDHIAIPPDAEPNAGLTLYGASFYFTTCLVYSFAHFFDVFYGFMAILNQIWYAIGILIADIVEIMYYLPWVAPFLLLPRLLLPPRWFAAKWFIPSRIFSWCPMKYFSCMDCCLPSDTIEIRARIW